MTEGWLTGWKMISRYVGLHKRTCQRYTKRYKMPVNFLPGGTPVAVSMELDEWLRVFSNIKKKQSS